MWIWFLLAIFDSPYSSMRTEVVSILAEANLWSSASTMVHGSVLPVGPLDHLLDERHHLVVLLEEVQLQVAYAALVEARPL